MPADSVLGSATHFRRTSEADDEEEAAETTAHQRRRSRSSELEGRPEFVSPGEVPEVEGGGDMWEVFNTWKSEKQKREGRPPELPAPTETDNRTVSE